MNLSEIIKHNWNWYKLSVPLIKREISYDKKTGEIHDPNDVLNQEYTFVGDAFDLAEKSYPFLSLVVGVVYFLSHPKITIEISSFSYHQKEMEQERIELEQLLNRMGIKD